MARGRPTLYSKEILEKAKSWVNSYSDSLDFLISVASLAIYLDVSRDTLYEWGKQHKDFSDILDKIMTVQEASLIQGGIHGKYNPTITKLMLTKHGYSDRTDTNINNPDGNLKTIIIQKSDASNNNTST